MHPHPPTNARLKGYTGRRFPGKGESIKASMSSTTNKKQREVKSTRKSNASELKQRSSNSRIVPLSQENLSCGSQSLQKSTNSNLTGHQPIKKRDSFSRYTPLPAINNNMMREEQSKTKNSKSSNKRTLQSLSTERLSLSATTSKCTDDLLSNTIKKMRLGTDAAAINDTSIVGCSKELDSSEQRSNKDEIIVYDTPTSDNSINLVIRLPKGTRVHHCFSSSDTLSVVLEFLSKQMKTRLYLKKYILYVNEVPKKELKSKTSTLLALGVKNRSVLALDTRD